MAIVALAFRNGPIEGLHAGKKCPTCSEKQQYSHISDKEMKVLMKAAADKIYDLLYSKKNDRKEYRRRLNMGALFAKRWDLPHR